MAFQSTRPSRGATDGGSTFKEQPQISIHAPLAGRDAGEIELRPHRRDFNPRAPRGARPLRRLRHLARVMISIHAPLAGRDPFRSLRRTDRRNFNPRAPRGARRGSMVMLATSAIFQSTRPSRGATTPAGTSTNAIPAFQSTRPSRGATRPHKSGVAGAKNFNPRAPRGARLACSATAAAPSRISIHAPLAGRDWRASGR